MKGILSIKCDLFKLKNMEFWAAMVSPKICQEIFSDALY